MQEEGGGSFWATFGGGTNGAEASGLEKLLQTPKCSVEALLDEEEVIQEFKTGNPNLVARLSEPDAIKVLMDCITCDPPPEAGNARCYRYPFVAVELMTCAPPKFLRLLVSPESNAMEQLWCFLTTPPAEVNPVLAGYFSRTATALMSKHQKEVLEYLRLRGPERLLQEFLDRIHLRSLAELFARLLSGESESEVVFQTCDLVARLLRRWQEDSNSDAQENITLVLAELLNQKESLFWIEDLTQQLIEPRTVQFLIDHIFAQPSGVPPAMLLLTTVIVHITAGLQEGTEVCAPSLSPLSVPPQLGEEMPANLDEPVVGEAAPTRAAPSTPHTSLKSSTSEWMERRRVHLMREVAGHFPSFRQLLDKSLEEGDTNKMTMPQGSIKALGGTTLEVISLLTTLSRSGLDVVLEAMLNNQLLPRCIKVFFQHPWSSLLHNWVKQLVMEVLSGTDSLRKQLSQQLLQEASLAERIVEEYAQEASWKTKKQKHARVGYMGHVFLMSSALQDCKSPEVVAVLSSTSGWSEVVAQLEATKKLHNEQLGGGVPASDRGLASSTRPTVTSDREGEDETQVAVCPKWSKRVFGGNFLAAEPIDLVQDQDSKAESPSPFSNGPDRAVPNGQGSLPSSPEDSFNPDFGAFDSAPSSGGASWASFPEVSAPSTSFPEPSFPSFETEWPAPMESASQSSTNSGWASFNEPAGVPTPPVPKDERLPLDPQLFSTGGHNAPPSIPPPVRDSPPFLNGPDKAVSNGQDAFNPDFAGVFDSAPSSSSASWASFPDVAPSPSTSFPQLSFPTFETEWPLPVKSASQSSTNSGWASFKEPAGVPTPPVPKDERPFDAQLFPTGGYTLPSTGSSLRDGSWIGDFDPLAPDLGSSKPRGATPWCGGVG